VERLDVSIEQLRGMLGLPVRYYGRDYRVFEVLEDGPALVLVEEGSVTAIQPGLAGGPVRRVPVTETVQVLTVDRTGLHADFLALELL